MSWTDKQRVVVPVDLSEITYSAVQVARDFTPENQNIHVIHVVREINPAVTGGLLGKEFTDDRPKISEEILKEKLTSEFPGVNIQVEKGEPGEMIPEFANSIQGDLLVMTSYGRKGMKEHMIGSVAERVLRLSKCPVLILKP